MSSKKYISSETIDDSDLEVSSSEDEQEYKFEAPRHYSLVSDLKSLKQLSKKNLSSNKELWLLKFPSDFQVKHLKSLPVNLNIAESTTFKTDDKSYKLDEDLTTSSATADSESMEAGKYSLLTPLPDGSRSNILKYQDHLKFSRFYNISESVKIPEIDYSKVVIQREDVPKVSGLRMRHFPTGYYIKDFKEAEKPAVDPQSKKRKADLAVDELVSSESKSKEKKDKKEKKEKKEKKHKKHKKEKKSKD